MLGPQPGGLLLSSRVSCRRSSARTEKQRCIPEAEETAVFRHTFGKPYFKKSICSLSLCGELEPVFTSAFWHFTVLIHVFGTQETVGSRTGSLQMNRERAPHLFSIKSSQKLFVPSENINIFVSFSSEGHMAWIVILPLEHGRSCLTYPRFNNCNNKCKSGF